VKLSVVIPTKNDEQNRHLATVLDQMSTLPIEVIVVDWGSEIPIEVPPWVRLIRVPSEIASRYNGDSYFAFATATNVGFRRASGDFLAYFGNDSFCDASLLQWLEGADSSTFYLISRKNIVSLTDIPTVAVSKMTRDLHASGGQLAHWEVWKALRGYDQRLIYYGWMDHEARVRAQLGGFRAQAVYEASVYHFRHPRNAMRKSGKVNERVFPPEMLHYTDAAANDEHWGLANEPLEEVAHAHEPVPG
jgi:hypothetical protein